jgi:hypothetical protein
MRRIAAWVLLGVLAASSSAAEAAPCAPAGGEAAAVQTVKDFFSAAHADDEAGFHRVVTGDFYAFDNGKTFHGDELFDLIKAAHAQGRRLDWTVTEPKVEVVCDAALVTYVNRGAVGDAKAMQPMVWLESAWLHYQDGHWRVAFLHSDRAAP